MECSNNRMLVDHVCPKASFLATGGFVKLFHKIQWFFHGYLDFFTFHDFSMHGPFLVIFQVFHDFQSLWEPWHHNLINVVYFTAVIYIRSTWHCTFWMTSTLNGHKKNDNMSHSMWFPTMWHFGNCRLRRAYAASFLA